MEPNMKNTVDTAEAVRLFTGLSEQNQQAVIDWIRSLLSER